MVVCPAQTQISMYIRHFYKKNFLLLETNIETNDLIFIYVYYSTDYTQQDGHRHTQTNQ